MKEQKRILLLSASAGSGHVRAAEAIKHTVEQEHPDIMVQHFDLVDYISLPTKKAFFDSYTLLATQLPELYGFLYRTADNPKAKSHFNTLTQMIQKIDSKAFLRAIDEFAPNHIVCTQFTAASIVNSRKQWKHKPTIATVTTDYEIHELWITSKEQHYFVATDKMKWKLERRGIMPDRVTVSGIPVDPVFFQKKTLSALRETYHIDEKKKTILVMSGGHGMTKIDKVVGALFQVAAPTTIIAIAGKNTRLKHRLHSLNVPKHIDLRVLGWTDTIDDYMRLADVVITKPGGITTTECITLGRPMIVIDPVPGQEEHNTNFILEHKYGHIARSQEDLLYYAQTTPENTRTSTSPNAAEKILKTILT